jgi:shikimate kinase
MPNIFLIGYMGAGKTSVGKRLAEQTGRPFVDMDVFIENRYHKKVSTLFAERGEAFFRQIESAALQEISAFESTVVATGGGAPCFFDNMDRMNRTGLTVYLRATAATLAQRLHTAKQRRPLVKDKSAAELERFIADHLAQREEWYNRASLIVEAESIRPSAIDTIIDLIIQSINKKER